MFPFQYPRSSSFNWSSTFLVSNLSNSSTAFSLTSSCFRNLSIICFSRSTIAWCSTWIKGPSVWNICKNLSKIGFTDWRKHNWTIASGAVSKPIIFLYLSLDLIFLSVSGNFLKYSSRAGNCPFTLSTAGNNDSHLDSTCLRKTISSRSSFCWMAR